MDVSVYSICSSIVWFNLFVLFVYFLRKKWGIVVGYHYGPLAMMVLLCVLRLFVPVETEHTIVFRSHRLLPWLQDLFQAKVPLAGSLRLSLGGFLLVFCSLVAAVLLARLGRVLWKEHKVISAIPAAKEDWLLHLFQKVQASHPSRRGCDLLVSPYHQEPFIFSLHRSRIVLPAAMTILLPEQDLYFILKHEWQHHADRDNQAKLFIEILCCLLWWNPFVYLLRNNLNQTLELKCDRKVTKHLNPSEKADYADSLVTVMRLHRKLSMEGKSTSGTASIRFLGLPLPKNQADQDALQRVELTLPRQKGRAGVMCTTCFVVLFLLSFTFVVQPFIPTPVDDLSVDTGIQSVSITPENSYLVDLKNGTYSLYINGEFFRTLGEDEAKCEPHSLLPIKTQE